MKIELLQLNYLVGDLKGNAEKILSACASLDSLDLAVTSELALIGYPPKDLLLSSVLLDQAQEQIQVIAKALKRGPWLLLGTIQQNPSSHGKPLVNSALLLAEGRVRAVFHKTLLPTYDVFEEKRYFESGTPNRNNRFQWHGLELGVTICEDIWNDPQYGLSQGYQYDPLRELCADEKPPDVILNLSASPFEVGKQKEREAMLAGLAQKYHVPMIYVNQVGGNDDLIFDGRSCLFSAQGHCLARAEAFEEDRVSLSWPLPKITPVLSEIESDEELWKALVTGTRDYVRKCGFSKALFGLSGGIDSAITAVIAAHALGKENVIAVLMPSPYSSRGSIDDSLELAEYLDIETVSLPIGSIMRSYSLTLQDVFQNCDRDVTEENIQARIRGNLLMALSNKYKSLLLTTGNKSELAVGYCTIYGDMCGALAVISDVWKTRVYDVCRWINKNLGKYIPENILTKAPSAELRPDQKDQDSLPAYEILDDILIRLIEQHRSAESIIQEGFDEKVVRKITYLVKISEFKRKQAAPVLKVTTQAFGSGWKMPLACKRSWERIGSIEQKKM